MLLERSIADLSVFCALGAYLLRRMFAGQPVGCPPEYGMRLWLRCALAGAFLGAALWVAEGYAGFLAAALEIARPSLAGAAFSTLSNGTAVPTPGFLAAVLLPSGPVFLAATETGKAFAKCLEAPGVGAAARRLVAGFCLVFFSGLLVRAALLAATARF
jgi:hypothetical protein